MLCGDESEDRTTSEIRCDPASVDMYEGLGIRLIGKEPPINSKYVGNLEDFPSGQLTNESQPQEKGSKLFGELGLHEFLVASTDYAIDHLSVLENEERRNRGDVELHGDVLVLIGVQLSERYLAFEFLGQFLDYRGQAAARPTPRSPAINDRNLVGFHEIVERAILDLNWG